MARLSPVQVNAAQVTAAYESLIRETRELLKRYSPEQIAKSKTLSRRKQRLEFYEKCVKEFQQYTTNSHRKVKRKTYLLGVCCDACGYTVRVTQKWLDVAMLKCPNPDCDKHGEDMIPMGAVESETLTPERLAQLQRDAEQERDELATEKGKGAALDFIREDDDFSG